MPRAWIIVVAACGGPHTAAPDVPPAPDAPQAGGAVTGTLAGNSLVVADALSGCGLLAGSPTLHVDLFNLADACSVIATSWPDSERWLSFDLFDFDPSVGITPTSAPGDHAVVYDDPSAAGQYVAVGYYGDPMNLPQGKTGAVSLSAVSATGVSGTFDVTLFTGEEVTGWFTAPRCDAVPGDTHNGGLFACP